MKPTTYTITLTVRTNAPIAVLRDTATWYTAPRDEDCLRYLTNILKVGVKECAPVEVEAQSEFGGCE